MTRTPTALPASIVWSRRLLIAAGVTGAGYGAAGLLTDTSVSLPHYFRYTAAVLLGHDLIVLPAAIAAGAVLTRRLPGWAKPPVQGALLVTATLTVVALPLLLGYGRRPDDPSALPRDYHRGYLVCLAAVWLVTAAVLAVRARRRTASDPEENQ
ncbi:hypothetical protein [Catellatospora bangladeshensis]|uniref:Uncharacterized protein n=1 Tax=Catellatospora bangladeshensis TaxID=310355 RepID=A0A8J3JLB0_9ACTN|nr:hypothetical protein [Catellatospora bangladeshensis]GIF84584.1 hypothetical protein Cba03nite_59330 [Catellatospora bangladeshensis]